jgi:probable rRNA maturation factor
MNGPSADDATPQGRSLPPLEPPSPADADRFTIDVGDAQERLAVDLARLRDVAVDVLRHEGVLSASISVALIDGATMQELNRQHLGHDYDTDVLSFLLDSKEAVSETRRQEGDKPRGAGKSLDGEILISTDVAAVVSERFEWSAEDEVTLYLVHGLLHLAGYDDLSPDEKTLMRQAERRHLARWNLAPVYHEPDDEARNGSAGEHSLSTDVRSEGDGR